MLQCTNINRSVVIPMRLLKASKYYQKRFLIVRSDRFSRMLSELQQGNLLALLEGKYSDVEGGGIKLIYCLLIVTLGLTIRAAGSFSMLIKGFSMSTLCLHWKMVATCTTIAPSVWWRADCPRVTLICARGPPCSLARRSLPTHWSCR